MSESYTRHQALIDALREFHVTFPRRPPDHIMDPVDDGSTAIPFVDMFYELGEGTFPNQDDGMFVPPPQGPYAARFFEANKERSHELFEGKYRKAWECRSRTAWASFVRDVQFYFLVQEYVYEGVFDEATYSPEADVQDGVDCKVHYEGDPYYVDLYVKSKKSRKYLQRKKNQRGHDYSHPHVHIPIGRYDSRNRNLETRGDELWLYSDEHIQDLIAEIEDTEQYKQ